MRIRAAVESARMRRLFLQADGQLQLHPLAQEIQVLTELGGEERGYRWRWRYRKICPPHRPDVRAGLLAVPAQVVVLARVHVRIVVTEAPRLQVSVVADSEPSHVAEIDLSTLRVSSYESNTTTDRFGWNPPLLPHPQIRRLFQMHCCELTHQSPRGIQGEDCSNGSTWSDRHYCGVDRRP